MHHSLPILLLLFLVLPAVADDPPHKWANVADRILNDPTFKPMSEEGMRWIAQQEAAENRKRNETAKREARLGRPQTDTAAKAPSVAPNALERRRYNRPPQYNGAWAWQAAANRQAMIRTSTPYTFTPWRR
jgi:hypothetical protein